MIGQKRSLSPVTIASEYFRLLDAGSAELFDLFSDELFFYFPKFGTGTGKSAFSDFATGIMTKIESAVHYIDPARFIVAEPYVVVEGTTSGRTHAGQVWDGGKTPGGRFCNIFEIDDGLIQRLFIYLDPDYAGDDTARFLWPDRTNGPW